MFDQPFTVEVTTLAETRKGETPIRRNAQTKDKLIDTPYPSCQSIYHLVQDNAKRWGDKPCFGTRKVIKIHNETTIVNKIVDGGVKPIEKKWMFWELGPFEWKSYKQVAQEGLDIGAGLVKIGLGKGDRIAIYAETSFTPENNR